MSIVTKAKAVIVLCCVFMVIGCRAGSSSAGSERDSGKQSEVLAQINGTVITTDDLNLELKSLPERLRSKVESNQGRRDMLDSMVFRELILQKARAEGLDKAPQTLEKLEDAKKRFIIETFLKNKLEREELVSDADLRKYYDLNSDKFKFGEQVRASHILIKTEKEAREILKQLESGGNFAELASKSACRDSASKGGDLGWFGTGVMVPEFEQAALSLKEGEHSDLVKTGFGYHIIKLTGRRAAGVRPFEEVKDQVRSAIISLRQEDLFSKIKEELRRDARISINENRLNALNVGRMGVVSQN